MLNTETIDLDMALFMSTLADDTAKFTPEKRAHFMHVIGALVDCYKSDAKHGIALLRDGAIESETMTLMAINADPTQTDEMIDTLCQLRGVSSADSAVAAVN